MKSHQKIVIACLSAMAAISMYGCDKGDTIGECYTAEDCYDTKIFTCDISRHSCVDESKKLDCNNGVQDELEPDVDCGGVCTKKCELGDGCYESEDCESGRCEKGECVEATCTKDKDCQAPAHSCDLDREICNTCTDKKRNGDETDVDCGGPCSPCKLGKKCDEDADCASETCDPDEGVCITKECEDDKDCPSEAAVSYCTNNECVSCFDGVKNGKETDVDCGGTKCMGCDAGQKCKKDRDCASENCVDNVCVGGNGGKTDPPDTCSNDEKDGKETDTDCGGSECDKCKNGKKCKKNSDCSSGNCDEGTCAKNENPEPGDTCSNEEKDDGESDIDCGGSCSPCAIGKSCSANDDCESGNCDGGTCAESSGPGPSAACDDGEKNGDESDVDCGGSCSACADGKSCSAPTDCVSGNCEGGSCVPAGPTVSCTDGEKNGDETDIDCGGSCAQKCDTEKACNTDNDCISYKCEGNLCKGADCKLVSGSGQVIVNEVFTNPNTSAKMEHSNSNQMK